MESFLVNILPLVLSYAAGAGLIVLEVFIPGFGLPGISGILLLALGTWLTARAFALGQAILVLVIVVILLTTAIIFILRSATKGKLRSSPFFLKEKEAVPDEKEKFTNLDGKTGTALTALRPAGIGLIEGKRIDVVADGEFIEANEPIIVTLVKGNRVVVKKA